MNIIKKSIFALLILYSSACYTLSNELKSKYGFMLLSEDYGILEESDFKSFTDFVDYTPTNEIHFYGFYWKCYPSENISFSLKEGDPSEDSGWKENMSHLKLIAKIGDKNTHDYLLGRGLPVSYNKKMLREWKRLIKNEPYVCINGQGVNEEPTKNIYSIFEGIKTRKGCFYYLHGKCNHPEPTEREL